MKRIAILFVLIGFVLFVSDGCGSKQTLSGTLFPDNVEFVVVDSFPENDTAQSSGKKDTVCVSATFVDGDSPVHALPVVLYEDGSAVFSAVTDDSGRIACGSLPVDVNIRFTMLVSNLDSVSLNVRFLRAAQSYSVAERNRDTTVIAPVAEFGGIPCADLLFQMDPARACDMTTFSAAEDISLVPAIDPLHIWCRTTLSLA